MTNWPSLLTKVIIFTQLATSCSWAMESSTTHGSTTKARIRLRPSPSSIIGGHEAKDGQFPYLVALLLTKHDDAHTGAGTLIKPNWVLTARHMVAEKRGEKSIKVHAESDYDVSPMYSNKLSEMRGKKKYKVEKMFCHHVTNNDEDWNYSDVALIKLNESIPLGNKSSYGFRTVPLFKSRNDVNWTKGIQITGWGQNVHGEKPKENEYPDHLLVVSTELNPDKKCREYFSFYYTSPETFCVGNLRRTGGGGDSGGPAIMKSVNKNEDIQVGIVSYGLNDARGPTVFANVSYFHSWIDDIIRDENPKDECKNVYAEKKER